MIKKIKKSMKKAGIAVVMTTLASTIIPKAQAEIIFYPLCSASISQLNLDKDFLNNLGDEYSKNIRDWNLRSDWQQPEPAKVLNSVGIGADVNLEKILKNIEFLKSCRKNLYFTAGMSICNFNSIYGQGYVFTDPDYKEYSDIIFRDEKIVSQNSWLE